MQITEEVRAIWMMEMHEHDPEFNLKVILNKEVVFKMTASLVNRIGAFGAIKLKSDCRKVFLYNVLLFDTIFGQGSWPYSSRIDEFL